MDDLYDARARCPACHSTKPRRKVHRIQRAPAIDLLRCSSCGIVSADWMPTEVFLNEYYSRYYDSSKNGITFEGKRRFACHIVSAISCLRRSSHLRLLDFGGGDGSLCLHVATLSAERGLCTGAEIVVVDPSNRPPARHPSISTQRVERIEDVTGRFDLIVAGAVLEHIPKVRECLHHLFSVAAPGAVFYARTPYYAPLLRYLPWLDFTFPGHVHDMGCEFWNGVVDTFALNATAIASRPSIVETTFRKNPLRTALAYSLKLPTQMEVRLRRRHSRKLFWRLCGGWEIFLRFR